MPVTPFNTYDYREDVRCTLAVTNSSGTATDPAALNFAFTDPSDNTTTYVFGVDAELVKDSTGNYHVIVDADEAGMWEYVWWGTGSGKGAKEMSFKVRESEFDG